MFLQKSFLPIYMLVSILFAWPVLADEGNCCGLGKYMENGVCTDCKLGHYCSGSCDAELCEGASIAPQIALQECIQCTGETPFANEEHTECVGKCDGASQYPIDGVCKVCESGSVAVVYNSEVYCGTCNPGLIISEDHKKCVECTEPNQYKKDGLCKTCPSGFFVNQNRTDCVKCGAGMYIDNGECKTCPAGYTCAGDGQAFKCSAGNYVANNECKTCPARHACTGDGQAVECPNDKPYVNAMHTQCISSCNESGFYHDKNNVCKECAAGYMCTDGVEHLCSGRTVSPEGESQCYECPDGYMSNKDHTKCIIPQTIKFGSTSLPDKLKLEKLNTNVLLETQQQNGENQ